EMRTTETPAPALVLATPPTIIKPLPMQPTTQIATRPRQMLDNPPIVAVPRAAEANIRQAAIPSARTTLVTRDDDRGPQTVRPFTGHKRRSPAPGRADPRVEEGATFPFR
ncbi:MAG TPA: hypothetical protein VL096_04360, partial [Pirellulaceae bacterium]|nr:hypothetical protein [Pirellulaceae bacterium]